MIIYSSRFFRTFFETLLICLLLFLHSPKSRADTLLLKNGDRLSGTILSLVSGKLDFESAYAGKIKIDWQQVDRFATESKALFVLRDDNTINGIAALQEKNSEIVIVVGEVLKTAALSPADIIAINPPKIEQKPVKMEGRVNVGSVFRSGNNDTSNVHFDSEIIARTLSNRYTAGVVFNWGESQDVETESNFAGRLKYDHFINQKWYLASSASFLTDRFKDLNLRSFFGVGLGYQFWESEIKNLSLEFGGDYFNEDYMLAPDESFPAAHFNTNFDHLLFNNNLQFFHKHQLYVGLEDIQNLLFQAQTGLRLPIFNQINATIQYNFDWDNSPAKSKVRTDEAWLLNMGYSW